MVKEIPVLDVKTALDRIENDRSLFGEIVAIYLEDAPKMIQAILTAIPINDREVIERSAHSLKSASANVGAEKARATAMRLEIDGPKLPIEEISRQAGRLQSDVFEAMEALKRYLET